MLGLIAGLKEDGQMFLCIIHKHIFTFFRVVVDVLYGNLQIKGLLKHLPYGNK